VVRPAVLLLDEPLSALDAQTRELLMEDLLAIWAREKSTRVYVTHNLEEAARLADREWSDQMLEEFTTRFGSRTWRYSTF
jgi:ABC-type nitrate/sulfonate/bicarbonate transport system ATPase subunit